MNTRLFAFLVLVTAVAASLVAGAGSETENPDIYSVGVFVPGVVDGSPTYELLVQGVADALTDRENAAFKVIEGGYNQAQWEEGIMSMAASDEYDLIVSTNPEMPSIMKNVIEAFPNARFLIMDAWLPDTPQVHTVMFNQREQAFLAGYFAGLVGQSSMVETGTPLRVGLLAGQEYPIMNRVILPGFELGLRSIDPQGTVDFRVLGNWYDAGAAAQLADSMYSTGSHMILPIAGGGNQGVIASAKERDAYVVWYDTIGLEEAPGTVIGSTYVALDQATEERVIMAMDGELSFGTAEVVGVADGYVGFAEDDPLYRRNVDDSVLAGMSALITRMRAGDLSLEMPLF